MPGQWCPDCRAYVADLELTCTECRRRKAWGAILNIIRAAGSDPWLFGGGPGEGYKAIDDALGAAAFLMQDRQALIHRHRAEMNGEIRAGQRAARDSYDQGHDDGQREGRNDW